MDNTEVEKKQDEYEQLEMELDKQIMMIMRMLVVLYPSAQTDPEEHCDI